jgi:hypothetical protein
VRFKSARQRSIKTQVKHFLEFHRNLKLTGHIQICSKKSVGVDDDDDLDKLSIMCQSDIT